MGRELARSTVLMCLRLAIVTGANFVAVRIILRAIGADWFGTYAAVVAAAGMPTFFAGALRGAAQRFLCVERGKTDGDVGRCFAEILALVLLLAGVVLLGIVLVGLVTVPSRYPMTLFAIVGALIVLQFLLSPLEVLIASEERFVFLVLFSVVQAILSLAVAGVVWLYPSAITYAAANAVVTLAVMASFVAYCRNRIKTFTLRPRFAVEAIGRIAPFFGWSALGSIAGLLKATGVVLVVNVLAGAVASAAFDAAYRIGAFLWAVANVYRMVYYPLIGKAWGSGDLGTFRAETYRAFRWTLVIFTPVVALLLVFAPEFLAFWLGDVPPGTVSFVRCLAVQNLFEALSTPFDSAVLVRGKIARYQVVLTVLFGASCPLAWLLLYTGAPAWTASGAVAFVTFLSFVYRLWMMRSFGNRAS